MFKSRTPQAFYSEANILTLVRLVFSLSFFILAVLKMNPTYNFIGMAIHLLGDYLDGWVARVFKQETILGAEIDIIADRLEALFFYVNFIYFRPDLFIPVAIYIIDYSFIDFYLSNQFLKYDIISPNYFYKVDRTVYLLNYSPLGKFSNSTVVVLMLIIIPQFPFIITFWAVALIGVKLFSIQLLVTRNKTKESLTIKEREKEYIL